MEKLGDGFATVGVTPIGGNSMRAGPTNIINFFIFVFHIGGGGGGFIAEYIKRGLEHVIICGIEAWEVFRFYSGGVGKPWKRERRAGQYTIQGCFECFLYYSVDFCHGGGKRELDGSGNEVFCVQLLFFAVGVLPRFAKFYIYFLISFFPHGGRASY